MKLHLNLNLPPTLQFKHRAATAVRSRRRQRATDFAPHVREDRRRRAMVNHTSGDLEIDGNRQTSSDSRQITKKYQIPFLAKKGIIVQIPFSWLKWNFLDD
ncbi:hypothetical protein Dimus_023754 [Dionaea muscipula]